MTTSIRIKREIPQSNEVKKCQVCTKVKNISEFYILNLKNKTPNSCKECIKDKNKMKTFRALKAQRIVELLKQELKQCSRCTKIKSIIEFSKNQSHCRLCHNISIKNYIKTNKGKIAIKKIRDKPHNKIINSMRTRIHLFLRGRKDKHSLELLGCTVQEWKSHLEAQFKPGMTWDNYGKYWEIDHIFPLSKAFKISIEEFYKALHYTNTQPLTCTENAIKKDKLL